VVAKKFLKKTRDIAVTKQDIPHEATESWRETLDVPPSDNVFPSNHDIVSANTDNNGKNQMKTKQREAPGV
jgi:hypothetical protein